MSVNITLHFIINNIYLFIYLCNKDISSSLFVQMRPEQVYDITLTARNKLSYFYLYVPGVPAWLNWLRLWQSITQSGQEVSLETHFCHLPMSPILISSSIPQHSAQVYTFTFQSSLTIIIIVSIHINSMIILARSKFALSCYVLYLE